MRNISWWFFGLATLFALAGMVWGIQMSISTDHTLAPAHAHNNLIGWVTLALFGTYYRLVPAAGTTRLAMVHFWLSFIGALTMGVGIAMAITGQGELLAQIASIATILGMAIFAYIVWTNRAGLSGA